MFGSEKALFRKESSKTIYSALSDVQRREGDFSRLTGCCKWVSLPDQSYVLAKLALPGLCSAGLLDLPELGLV